MTEELTARTEPFRAIVLEGIVVSWPIKRTGGVSLVGSLFGMMAG
jgi:hypothetical protein